MGVLPYRQGLLLRLWRQSLNDRYFGKNKIDIRVEQGYEIGRPSLLYLRAEEKEGKINVSVGGKVAMVAKGKLN